MCVCALMCVLTCALCMCALSALSSRMCDPMCVLVCCHISVALVLRTRKFGASCRENCRSFPSSLLILSLPLSSPLFVSLLVSSSFFPTLLLSSSQFFSLTRLLFFSLLLFLSLLVFPQIAAGYRGSNFSMVWLWIGVLVLEALLPR